MSRTRTYFALTCASLLASSAFAQTPLTTELVAGGFQRPVWVGSPPGDENRLFVVEQKTARIRIIDVATGAIKATDFLAILPKVFTTGNEQGLFSMAFHPDYATNGLFYVSYTRKPDAASIIERYSVSSDPDVADANSGVVMFGPIPQPFSNHNGGNIVFGPDGFLYLGLGDGGSGGDPQCNAQKPGTVLGKLLRMDVSTVPATAAPGNPFLADASYDPRIWAVGLRNPWRFSFDALNGDLYIGDVGQENVEEVNYVPGTSTGGENYGWKMMEGNNCFGTSACPAGIPPCNSPLLTDPIHAYSSATGSGNCSVTAGYVYRGCGIPDLQGTFFFADYCSSRIWSFEVVGGAMQNFTNRTNELDPPGALTIDAVTSFGVDDHGEMYLCDQTGGEIYKIVPAIPPAGEDLGFGKVGGNGLVPDLDVCGLLDTGNTAQLSLEDAAPNAVAILFGSTQNNPSATIAGTLVPVPPLVTVVLFTNAQGGMAFNIPGGNGPLTFFVQFAIADPGAKFGANSSNAVQMNFLP